MAHRTEPAAPVMRAGTGFQRHFGRLQLGEERLDLRPPEITTQHRPFHLIDPVDREDMLGRVDRNPLVCHRAALSLGWFTTLSWHIRCRGAVHPNNLPIQ